MPFSTNAELPPAVRAKLDNKKQNQFRSVFNSVFAESNDERKAFASAFSAVAVNKGVNELPDTGVKWATQFDISKTDEDQQLVFGWLSVAVDKAGTVVVDSQDDIIEEDVLEKAAYDFTLDSRKAGDMHERIEGIGRLVESMVFTVEKQKALGIPEGSVPIGWWVGFKISDDQTWAKVKSGEYSAFSIGGKALREEVS